MLLRTFYLRFFFLAVCGAGITDPAGAQISVPKYASSVVDTNCSPSAVVSDAAGNAYEACPRALGASVSVVRKITPNGTATTVAGGGADPTQGDNGPATAAFLDFPCALALDSAGNLFIADNGSYPGRIRKVSTNGIITTIAGPGPSPAAFAEAVRATNASISPAAMAFDATGNLLVADSGFNRIREISTAGIITTIAGTGSAGYSGDGGPAISAQVQFPNPQLTGSGITVDAKGDFIFTAPGAVRKISPSGTISTIAGLGYGGYFGDGGLATLAGMGPVSLAMDSANNIYIADTSVIAYGPNANSGQRVRVIGSDGKINTILGYPATAQPLVVGAIAMVGGSNLYIAAGVSAQLQLELLKPSGGSFSPGPSVVSYGDPPDFGSTTSLGQASWVTIYGNYLSSNSRAWTSADFTGNNAPTTLDGTSVTIGGQPAYISYISPGQINAQVPNNIGTGPQPLIVTTPSGSSSAWTPTVNPTNPGLLAPASFKLTATQFYPYAVALFPDGVTYVLPVGTFSGVASHPAVAGDTITFYGIGFGDVTPYSPAGQITGGQHALAQPFGMTFVSGSQQAKGTVSYAGLSPGSVGLYQFNVVVPKLSVSGPVTIQVSLGGTTFGVYYVALQ